VTSTSALNGGYGDNGLAAAAARLAQQARKSASPDQAATTAEATAASDQVTLSPAAARLLKARQNLAAREADPANLGAAEWQRLMADATVTAERRGAADQQIAALETSDPDHAMVAKQARAFAADAASGGTKYQNPFEGMDRISLTAIATDETGLYTNDERDAAEREMNRQQQSWIQRKTNGGVGADFYATAKQQYAQLSPLEKSRYPANYLDQCDQAAASLAHGGSTDPYWWMDGSSQPPEDVSPDTLVADAAKKLQANQTQA
jgi:hypothetical protein